MNDQDNQQPSSRLGQTETHRVCTKCGLQKPIETFKLHGKYRRRSCQECDRPMFRQKHKEWRDKNRAHLRAYARESMKRHRKTWTSEKRAGLVERAKMTREKLRRIVYLAYGAVCNCCGEDELNFLSLDHVNNDGYARRKNGEPHGGGAQLFKKIIEAGFPSDFQILCMNCNHGKARNGGVCPHQEKVQRLSGNGVEPSGSKRPALFCEEVKI